MYLKIKRRGVFMNRLALALILCFVTASFAFGDEVKNITSALKDKATSTAKETAKEVVDDSTITAEVKAKIFAADSLKDEKIKVSTVNGIVKLAGTVKTKQAKGAATKIAKAVKGVRSVSNQITIEKSAGKK